MKSSLHTRLICCWLAVMVLLTSVGFGMVEHWCQMRGHSKTLLVAQDSCQETCKADETTAPFSDGPLVKQMPCCKTTLSYQHLDVSRFVVDHSLPSAHQPAAFIANPQFQLLLAVLHPVANMVTVDLSNQETLPRTGRFRLTTYCTWLI